MADSAKRPEKRAWIGILFECCGVYARIYRASKASAYRGRCPRCLSTITLSVGDGGTDTRQFRAR
ncbi:MAG: hypothetical protein CMJ83_11125 [Planctomycetes bacterium]|nr:hypothetical protein [Planctomycetota bacterium]